MTYEYLNEIQNSGINRNAFPASCSSYMEMGMYIMVDTTKEINKIFETAGIIEFDKYSKNTINEANAKAIKDEAIKRVKAGLIKAWEGIKAVFEKALAAVLAKLEKFAEISEKFKNLNFSNYTEALKKVFGGDDTKNTIIDPVICTKLKSDLSSAKTKLDNKVANSKQYDIEAFKDIIKLAFGSSIENSAPQAKAAIEAEAMKKTIKVSYKYFLNKSNITDLTKVINEAPNDIRDTYSTAKKAINEAQKSIKAEGEDIKSEAMAYSKIILAYENCLLGVMDVRRKSFIQAMVVAGKAVAACKIMDDNKTKKDKAADKAAKETAKADKETVKKANDVIKTTKKATGAKNESVSAPEVEAVPDIIDEAFNW